MKRAVVFKRLQQMKCGGAPLLSRGVVEQYDNSFTLSGDFFLVLADGTLPTVFLGTGELPNQKQGILALPAAWSSSAPRSWASPR